MGDSAVPLAIVTGAGSGIGRATAIALAGAGVRVIAVGRRADALCDTAGMASGSVHCVSADVSTDAGRRDIADALGAEKLGFLVHGAAISPVNRLTDTGAADIWDETMRINLDPLFHLTVMLAPALADGGRVLFVGSNSASRPRLGGAAYCVSKAAGHMLYRCLKQELADQRIFMTSAIPSPVYTAIVQHHIAADPAVFPDGAEYARQLRAGEMIAPETVGRFYRWLLIDTADERFSAEQWHIQDAAHHGAWLEGALFIAAAETP